MKKTIQVAYVNQPKEGKKNGSVKDDAGTYYDVRPENLSNFTPGQTYAVEIKSREYNGKTYYSIEGAPQNNGTAAPNGPNGAERQHRIERQHSQSAAIDYCVATGVPLKGIDGLRRIIDWFQLDIGHVPVAPDEPAMPDVEGEIDF